MKKTDRPMRRDFDEPAQQDSDGYMHPLLVAALAALIFSAFVYGGGNNGKSLATTQTDNAPAEQQLTPPHARTSPPG